MTEQTPAPEEKATTSKRKYILLVVGVVMLALLAGGIFASRMGLDKALVRQRLDALATRLHEEGKKEGRDITLRYKDVAIVGSFSNRHAVIVAPELSIKPLQETGKKTDPAENLIVRTDEISVYPRAVDLSKVKLHLEKPIDFLDASDESRKLLAVSSAQGFEIDIAQSEKDNRPYLEVTHDVPTEIELEYLREKQAQGEEDATPEIVAVYETLKITQAAGGVAKSNMAQDGSGLGSSEVKLSDIALIPQVQPEGAIRIADVSGEWTHVLNEKKHHALTAKLHVGDITAEEGVLPYAPISLTLDAEYEGAAPQTAQDLSAIRAQESSLKLHKFALRTKQAKFAATADFIANATDVLPVGMATLTLSNVPFVLAELQKYGLLDSRGKALLDEVLSLTTGTPIAEMKDAEIEISRARGGSFAIGKTTFEELFATVLKHSLSRPATAPAPKPVPAAPEKDIKVEEGARG